MNRLRIACLASNNGTSFRAVHGAIQHKRLDAEPIVLVSNKETASALVYAKEHGIPCFHIPTKDREADADQQLRQVLVEHGADVVVLAGYLRKLGPLTLDAFERRILNVHPGLLPQYGGLGMYGRKVHQAVLDNGEISTGATIHLVDAEYDHGRSIATATVPIEPSDDVATLERRVMAAECDLFIEVVRRIVIGELTLPL
ncbi:phosphoribosylglycinamide formyltransferase [Agrobacterium rhizogenes]|nr:phosphoribosylglycinamide formyltransferase [Rhizobium rhizogenes]NTJ77494.1 phosphoribosylglycinamide formyltransferase [Rhizobium rhizogenes]